MGEDGTKKRTEEKETRLITVVPISSFQPIVSLEVE